MYGSDLLNKALEDIKVRRSGLWLLKGIQQYNVGLFVTSNLGQILGKLLIGRNLKWSVLMGRALIAARGRHGVIPYYRSNGQNLGMHFIGREQFHRQGRYKSIVSTDLIGREQSRDLRRHTSFAYHVTSLWRLPSCFATMLFCDDTVTKRRCYESNVSTVLIGREQSRDL